jgi:hypothetical protein
MKKTGGLYRVTIGRIQIFWNKNTVGVRLIRKEG